MCRTCFIWSIQKKKLSGITKTILPIKSINTHWIGNYTIALWIWSACKWWTNAVRAPTMLIHCEFVNFLNIWDGPYRPIRKHRIHTVVTNVEHIAHHTVHGLPKFDRVWVIAIFLPIYLVNWHANISITCELRARHNWHWIEFRRKKYCKYNSCMNANWLMCSC